MLVDHDHLGGLFEPLVKVLHVHHATGAVLHLVFDGRKKVWHVVALLVALLAADEFGQAIDLVAVDEGALDPLSLDTCVIEHVSLADQFLGSRGIKYRGGVDPGNHPEGHPRREVSLDKAGDHIHGRPLRRQDDVDAGGPSLLGEADDRCRDAAGRRLGLSAAAHRHGEVGIFIDDGDYVGQELVPVRRKQVAVLVFFVVEFDVRDVGLAQKLVPFLHLCNEALQDLVSLVSLLDDGIVHDFLLVVGRRDCEIVLDKPLVSRELHHLRIDEHQLEFGGMLGIKQRCHYCIESDGLPLLRCSCDEQVRSVSQVEDLDRLLDSVSYCDRKFRLACTERFVVEGLRTDSLYIGNIRVSQAVSAIIFVVSVIIQIVMFFRIRRDPESYELYCSTEESRLLIEESRRKRLGLSAEDIKIGADDDDDESAFDDDEDDGSDDDTLSEEDGSDGEDEPDDGAPEEDDDSDEPASPDDDSAPEEGSREEQAFGDDESEENDESGEPAAENDKDESAEPDENDDIKEENSEEEDENGTDN